MIIGFEILHSIPTELDFVQNDKADFSYTF
jgi:hypothetical protein